MPWSNEPGGPWGGGDGGGDKKGSNGGGGGPWGGGGGGRGGGGRGGGEPPNLDDLIRQGQDRLKSVLGGGGRGGGSGGGGGGGGPSISRGGILFGLIALVGVWVWASLYTVKPEEASVELFFGERYRIGQPGLNFAPWPVVKAEIRPVTRETTIDIGFGATNRTRSGRTDIDDGLMLTGDENIVDIDFQVVWNIRQLEDFLFNLAAADETIRAVSESAMREIIGQSELKPILNRDRALVSQEVTQLIQSTLDNYNAGVNIVRVNFDKADPPDQVIDAFRDVQAAEQDRDTSEKQAELYANERLASARGESAQVRQQAEAYRAQIVNEADGEAARFVSVYEEYSQAEEVTRKRLYIETMERVLGQVDKIIIDEQTGGGGQGVVPYLPLNELRRSSGEAK